MNEFFEEFKYLEKLCSEMYGEEHGVSLYISDMENVSPRISGRIPGWKNDLSRLKRVRYIRNTMGHDISVDFSDYSTDDLEFIRSFHQRIIYSEDPLAILRQHKQQAMNSPRTTSGTATAKQTDRFRQSDINSYDEHRYNRISRILYVVIAAGLIVILVLILVLML